MLTSGLTREECERLYIEVMEDGDRESLRELCREDLYFLLSVACGRDDIRHPWLFERVREVEAEPDGCLDLWARGHYKSTIITFGKTAQDILKDPEQTFGFFSHIRPVAKSFLRQIQLEFENNDFLKDVFDDILYQNPRSESPTWSLDHGITVKRKSNPKESTVEAWGLVDGQPTGKHFRTLVFDDVVTQESVSTPEQIAKTTAAWELAQNLDTTRSVRRYIGTRYHKYDTYATMIERSVVKLRIHAATEDGTMDGKPVFLTPERLAEKRRQMGPYVFSCQMLQNPVADKSMDFKEEWINHFTTEPPRGSLTVYIIVDPADAKGKKNDYTTIWVVGLGVDENYYVLDGVRARMNLTERTERLIDLVRKWRPISVGYEKYGIQCDIQHIKYVQEQRNYRFPIIPLGGQMSKNDRIRRLVPLFERGRFYFPNRILFKDAEGEIRDMVQEFVRDEYLAFPVAEHDDMLDDLARILDEELKAQFPKAQTQEPRQKREYKPF